MSWTNFLIVIFIVYLVYYSLNLLFDLLISSKPTQGEIAEDELFFSQTFSPELISAEETKEIAENQKDNPGDSRPSSILSPSPISSSGGVALKQLFSLAKNNLIEHTRAIPY